MSRYTQRKDGVPFTIRSGEMHRIACCDCGLVHDVLITLQDSKTLRVCAKRNNRATAQRRRKRQC